MARVLRIGVVVLAGGLLTAAATSAQGTAGSGSIAGVVKDQSGAVLPGVTVEASSPALIEKTRAGVTDAEGQYRIVNLRAGTYTVTFTLVGFSTIKQNGIELSPNFTAPVDAVLKVGELSESITVSGQNALVDVQNVAQQSTLSKRLLDTVPNNRTVLGYAALIPSAIIPPANQDVGGSMGDASVRIAIHGSHQADQKLLQDGMRYNSTYNNGTGRPFIINPAVGESATVDIGAGGSAEYSVGGAQVNLIPKDGGNIFNAYFVTGYTGPALISDNSNDALRAAGLREPNKLQAMHDFMGSVGGPVKHDKLWFYSAHRLWGTSARVANLFYDATWGSPIYTPDLSRPVYQLETHEDHSIRMTWQASAKHKITGSYEFQANCKCVNGNVSTATEAATGEHESGMGLYQATWTYPASTRLLLEGGYTLAHFNWNYFNQQPGSKTEPDPGVVPNTNISILEQSTGFRYNAGPYYFAPMAPGQTNGRFSASYVTGSHNFKAGFFLMRANLDQHIFYNASLLTYTFSNGRPVSLTEYASNLNVRETLSPELGLYVQDQWTTRRLTLNLGLRYEYLREYVPASSQPAGLYVPARSYGEVTCVPCWHDISPRFGVAYDLFGTGKTALKFGLGRYVVTETLGLASAADPASGGFGAPAVASVNSVNRSWTDTNGNFSPDCVLSTPGANGECGPISNVNFGKTNTTTTFDPDYLKGWGKRGYDWQLSAMVQQQVTPSLAIGGGYFRTWYGNFTVTDNVAVEPSDYDPYCVTAPVDSRLPGGGGNQICGLYNLNPAKFGQVQNLVTFASPYGKQTEVYNGVDANFSIRFPRGGEMAGGFNIGNSLSPTQNVPTSFYTVASTTACFVVDSPQQLYQCEQPVPYQKRFKVNGSYPLPWHMEAAAVFQSLPGAPIRAIWSAPNALIAPSLGRNLTGGSTATFDLFTPYSQYEDRITQLDVRLARYFNIQRVRIKGTVDAYNVLNASPILTMNQTYGPNWLTPGGILAGRTWKFGFQLDF